MPRRARETSDHEIAELELESLELEAELSARRADLAEGLVPQGITRALLDHELASRVNFAAIEAELDTAAASVESRLTMDRQAFLALLEADLAGQETPEKLLERIVGLDGPVGLMNVKGAKKLVDDAARFHRGILYELAMAAALRVRQEAGSQGVTVPKAPAKLSSETKAALEAQALRLAQGPLVDLVRAVRERAFLEAAR